MNKEEKRDLIVERSRELFAKFGFKKTTVSEIADKCHMSKATLYYYFNNKEDIFKAVIERELNAFKKRLGDVLSKEKTPQDKLRVFVMTRAIHLKELANYYSTIKDEYLERYAFVEHERRNFTDWEIQTVKSILDEGRQMGVFNTPDSKLTAAVIVFALKGLEYPWIVGQDMIEIERAVDLMLPVLFNGISTRHG